MKSSKAYCELDMLAESQEIMDVRLASIALDTCLVLAPPRKVVSEGM